MQDVFLSPGEKSKVFAVEKAIPLWEDFFVTQTSAGEFLTSENFAGVRIKIKKNGFVPKGGLYLLNYLSGQNVTGACLDIGCGETGVIAQFLKLFGASRVLGVDVDQAALDHAKTSSSIAPEVQWLYSDVYRTIPDHYMFDLIVSNPPQMPSQHIESIHDDGGRDGLLIVRNILQNARQFLLPDGKIVLLLFDFLFDCRCVETNESVATIADALGYRSEVVARYERAVRPQGKTFERLGYIEDAFEGFRFKRKGKNIYHKIYVIEFGL